MSLNLQTSNRNHSYVLNNKNKALGSFILNEINKHTYFKTHTLRKQYIENLKRHEITDITQSVSVRIGRFVNGLEKLDLVIKYDDKNIKTTWKNLYKNSLFDELEKRFT